MAKELKPKIRSMQAKDLDMIVGIAKGLPDYFLPEEVERLGKEASSFEGLVAIKGEEVVGYLLFRIRWDERLCMIENMAVRKDLLSKGIGGQLCNRLFSVARSEGIQTVKVATLSPTIEYEAYEKTRNFYIQRMGFEEGPTIPDYWYKGSDPAIVLSKRLT